MNSFQHRAEIPPHFGEENAGSLRKGNRRRMPALEVRPTEGIAKFPMNRAAFRRVCSGMRSRYRQRGGCDIRLTCKLHSQDR